MAVPVIGLLLLTAPVLLPEYRAPQTGQLDLLSVTLSLAAILPVIYGIKHAAEYGLDVRSVTALLSGAVFSVIFIQRQRNLMNPLLDMSLFTNRAFSVALGILLIGLIGVGGVMLLVTQYLQLVVELSPLSAGMWMGPPALMMFAAAIASPLLARYIRPGFVVAGALMFSTAGYLLLTRLESTSGIALAVTGFSLVYLGLGTIAALGTDLVVGSAPAARAGSASAMSETVQELGIAMGVAMLGSISTAVYRSQIGDHIPASLSDDVSRAVGDSLWGVSSVVHELPADLLDQAKIAFTSGLNTATMVSGAVIMVLAILSAVMLRHIGTTGSAE